MFGLHKRRVSNQQGHSFADEVMVPCFWPNPRMYVMSCSLLLHTNMHSPAISSSSCFSHTWVLVSRALRCFISDNQTSTVSRTPASLLYVFGTPTYSTPLPASAVHGDYSSGRPILIGRCLLTRSRFRRRNMAANKCASSPGLGPLNFRRLERLRHGDAIEAITFAHTVLLLITTRCQITICPFCSRYVTLLLSSLPCWLLLIGGIYGCLTVN